MRRRGMLLGVVAVMTTHCSDRVVLDCASEPQMIAERPTGFATCGALVHRPLSRACSTFTHVAPAACATSEDDSDCLRDHDCQAGAYGFCDFVGASPTCSCSYGCVTDLDCGEESICACGETVSLCVPSACTTDDSCPDEGALCVFSITDPCEGGTAPEFACLTGRDECTFDDQCDAAFRCVLGIDGVRTCQPVEFCSVTDVD